MGLYQFQRDFLAAPLFSDKNTVLYSVVSKFLMNKVNNLFFMISSVVVKFVSTFHYDLQTYKIFCCIHSCCILVVLIQEFTGEWELKYGNEVVERPKDNVILGHILHRMFSIVTPPEVMLGFLCT